MIIAMLASTMRLASQAFSIKVTSSKAGIQHKDRVEPNSYI